MVKRYEGGTIMTMCQLCGVHRASIEVETNTDDEIKIICYKCYQEWLEENEK